MTQARPAGARGFKGAALVSAVLCTLCTCLSLYSPRWGVTGTAPRIQTSVLLFQIYLPDGLVQADALVKPFALSSCKQNAGGEVARMEFSGILIGHR